MLRQTVVTGICMLGFDWWIFSALPPINNAHSFHGDETKMDDLQWLIVIIRVIQIPA